MTEREIVGKILADKRNETELSVRALAELAKVSYQNITKIENGKYNVSIDILSKIANALGLEIALRNRSRLRQFVFDNQDRDDILGDLVMIC
ncbi:MAG: helix-turn-helix transcriptional regulator [Bacteroides intestinalis]|jgi:transcriptional regulator with XRE-family HTH domain